MILLDTCVVSEALKPDPSEAVLYWIESLAEDRVYLSALVIGELQKGVTLLEPGTKRSLLELWLEQLTHRFQGRILPFDQDCALVWGRMVAVLEQQGQKVPLMDSLIGAQALKYQALLATRNVRDYQYLGVNVINPWDFGSTS